MLENLSSAVQKYIELLAKGYSLEKIADMTDTPSGTIRLRLYQARIVVGVKNNVQLALVYYGALSMPLISGRKPVPLEKVRGEMEIR